MIGEEGRKKCGCGRHNWLSFPDEDRHVSKDNKHTVWDWCGSSTKNYYVHVPNLSKSVLAVLCDEKKEKRIGDMADSHKNCTSAYLHHKPLSLWFWLFLKLNNIRGSCWEDIEMMKEAVTKVLNTFILDEFHGVLRHWVDRYIKRTGVRGCYIKEDNLLFTYF